MSKKIETAIATTINGNTLTMTFGNGETLTVNAASLNDTIRTAAMMHGLKQKLSDAAAISRNPDTGRSATIDDKFEAVRDVWKRITSADGTWNKNREAGEGGATGALLVRALVALTGKARGVIEEQVEAMSKEQKAALRANPKVAAKIAELKSANADIDSDSLLDSLMGDAPADEAEDEGNGPEADEALM